MNLSKRPFDRLKDPCPVVVGVDDLDTCEVQSIEQMSLGGVGEQELDIGAMQIGQQRTAATGAVDADRDVPAQTSSGQPQQHFRGVVHQQPDMGRTSWVQKLRDRGGPRRGVRDELAPGPRTIAGQQRRSVLRGSREKEVSYGHAGSAARSRPRGSACSVAPPYSKS